MGLLYNEAELLYQEALRLKRQLLGEDHPDVAISLNNLAFLYKAQCRYVESEICYRQALEISECQLGFDHPNTQTFRKNLEELRSHQKTM